MRSTQIIGLHEKADKFIEENSISSYHYKDASCEGMFDDGPVLYGYIMRDGSVWVEELQAIPWSSGPMIFTKLVNKDDLSKEIAWTEEEIDGYQ